MTELIKIGILYLIFLLTAIWATGQYKTILQKLSKSIQQLADNKVNSRIESIKWVKNDFNLNGINDSIERLDIN